MASEARAHPVARIGGGAEDPFVGRRREIKALSASLGKVRSGRGRLDIVSGPPGIGKTRLTSEIAAVAQAHGMRVLRGGCWEGEGAPAYWPWSNVLRSALGATADEVVMATDLGVLLQSAASGAGIELPLPVDVSQDAQQARFVLFDRYAEYLAATAAVQPTLVIVDDVHWADTGSLLLLQFLAGRLGPLALALLVTSRDPLSELVAAAGRHSWAGQLALGGLSRAEASALIEGRLARPPGAGVLDRLMRLTEGNPYFLKELGQLLVEDGGVPATRPELRLPASLLVVALQPYQRLSPACRRLLQAAAVVGREFDSELTAAAAGIPLREALALLDEAIARQVVAAADSTRYRFAHALLREAIHDQLHLSDRAQLHHEITVALEHRLESGERVSSAALAHHAYLALPLTDRRRTAAHTIAAGQDAFRACAFEEAVLHLRRAQEAAGPTLSDSDTCDLLLQLGAAEAGAGDWARSRRTFADAAALARHLDSPERLARAALGFKGMMLATLPVDSEAVALLHEARIRLSDETPNLIVEIYSALSTSLYFDDPTQCESYSQRAMTIANAAGGDRQVADALLSRLLATMRPHSRHSILPDANDLLHLGSRLRDPVVTFYARVFRYTYFLAAGLAHDALRELRLASELPTASHTPRSLWQVTLFQASHAIAAGDTSSASRLAREALTLGHRLHDPSAIQNSLLQTFQLSRFTKDFGALRPEVSNAADLYAHSPGYLAALALINVELGSPEDSRDILRFFAKSRFQDVPSDFFTLYILCTLADAVCKCNNSDWARMLYDLLLPYESQYIVAGLGTAIDGSVAHYLATLALTFGDNAASLSHFESALNANSQLHAPPLLARTQIEYAKALRAGTNELGYDRSRTLASLARHTCLRLGLSVMQLDADILVAPPQKGLPNRLPPDTHATPNLLVRIGDYWKLRYAGHEALLRHRIGFSYIASLLLAQGEQVHVLALTSGTSAALPPSDSTTLGADATARRAYKQTLSDLDAELALATANNDLSRLDYIRDQRDALISELSYSFGLAGRPRPLRSPTERARVSVKNRITSALHVLRAHHELAYKHLTSSLRTGTCCTYAPDTPHKWTIRDAPGV